MLLKIVWESGETIFSRLLDGVEPEVLESLYHALQHVPEVEVEAIAALRARWLGHRLRVEMDLALPSALSLQETREITQAVEEKLKAQIPHLGWIAIRGIPDTNTISV